MQDTVPQQSVVTGLTLDSARLRLAGRSLPTPFTVTTAVGPGVTIKRVLRIIPGKRLVGEGVFENRPVLVKLFYSRRAAQHRRRELRGIRALQAAGINTPELIDSHPLADGEGFLVLSRFLESARPLDATGDTSHPEWHEDIEQAFALVGQLHAAGLRHKDLHTGNFLKHGGRLYLLDGDAVGWFQHGKALSGRPALRNLATVAAAAPAVSEQLLAVYHRANPSYLPDMRQLEEAALRIRTAGRPKDMRKALRNSTRFVVQQSFHHFRVIRRRWREPLAALAENPDGAMAGGQMLKNGGSSTVVAIDSPAGPAVIKRYNIKSPWHGFRRLWRPSRAWVSWRAARLLEIIGLHTPAQLAMVEERIGPLRRRAWLVTAYCPGTPLSERLCADRVPSPNEAEALQHLLGTLWRERVSHGDLKASNLLFHRGNLFIIDLDSVKRHRFRLTHRRAWCRDRQRLLDNWPRDSVLYHWLDEHLPSGRTESAATRYAATGIGPLQYLVYSSLDAAPSVTLPLC